MPAETDVPSRPETVNPCRSARDILVRIAELKAGGDDYFGFQQGDLIEFLPFSEAKEFLKPDITGDQWQPSAADEASVKDKIRDYMPFAWGKANDCRGLSAGRSVEHLQAWLWLLDDQLGEKLQGIYRFYGKPCLRVVCEKYGWDWRQWDDGCWRNSEDDDGVSPPAYIDFSEQA